MMRASSQRALRGFTLVEVAIVLVLLSLLLGAFLSVLPQQDDNRRRRESQVRLDTARQALLAFAAANGYLPCPADPALASGADEAGQENRRDASDCRLGQEGALPWATLGLQPLDAWTHRIAYRVAAPYVKQPAAGALAGFALDQPCTGTANCLAVHVCEAPTSACRHASGVAVYAPFTLWSSGGNGYGAYDSAGRRLPVSSDPDEAENGNGDDKLVAKRPTDRTENESYDDLVSWVGVYELKAALLHAGRLP